MDALVVAAAVIKSLRFRAIVRLRLQVNAVVMEGLNIGKVESCEPSFYAHLRTHNPTNIAPALYSVHPIFSSSNQPGQMAERLRR